MVTFRLLDFRWFHLVPDRRAMFYYNILGLERSPTNRINHKVNQDNISYISVCFSFFVIWRSFVFIILINLCWFYNRYLWLFSPEPNGFTSHQLQPNLWAHISSLSGQYQQQQYQQAQNRRPLHTRPQIQSKPQPQTSARAAQLYIFLTVSIILILFIIIAIAILHKMDYMTMMSQDFQIWIRHYHTFSQFLSSQLPIKREHRIRMYRACRQQRSTVIGRSNSQRSTTKVQAANKSSTSSKRSASDAPQIIRWILKISLVHPLVSGCRHILIPD